MISDNRTSTIDTIERYRTELVQEMNNCGKGAMRSNPTEQCVTGPTFWRRPVAKLNAAERSQLFASYTAAGNENRTAVGGREEKRPEVGGKGR